MNRTINKHRSQSLITVNDIDAVKESVSRIFDSFSIHGYEISKQGIQYRITIPSKFFVPMICLKQLESEGFSVGTFHSESNRLEITIGGNRK